MLNTTNAKATYTHDCDSCRFLGTVKVPGKRALDFYECEEHRELIARHGSEGPAYRAAPIAQTVIGYRPAWFEVAKALSVALTPDQGVDLDRCDQCDSKRCSGC